MRKASSRERDAWNGNKIDWDSQSQIPLTLIDRYQHTQERFGRFDALPERLSSMVTGPQLQGQENSSHSFSGVELDIDLNLDGMNDILPDQPDLQGRTGFSGKETI